ncbi:MAG TPA: anti-sigma factor [Acidimicrobiales bacterium]|nr:anti-sigma factor [Acidimicrobiales bacterium]
MTALDHADAQELLGAFALDALDPAEADAVDVHLRDCPRCRAEVEEYRETAAMLAFGGVAAPPGVWERIQASLEEAPPKLELARVVPIRSSRWQTVGAKLAAAAAVVISLVALGVSARGGSDAGSSLAAEIGEVVQHPDATPVLLEGDGSVEVYLLDGKAYLVKHSLPELPEGQTYQLWGQQGETKVSLAVLGGSPEQSKLPLGGSYQALAITAEQSPGVVSSSNPAVVAGLVRSD